jgi:hypothetical protein
MIDLQGQWNAVSYRVLDEDGELDYVHLGLSYEILFEAQSRKQKEYCFITLMRTDKEQPIIFRGKFYFYLDNKKLELIGEAKNSPVSVFEIVKMDDAQLELKRPLGDSHLSILLEKVGA